MLDLAKVEAGKLEFDAQPVDLQAVVGEVIGNLEATAAARKIQVESHIDPGLTDVVLDEARLRQVLYNYASNALKFTPEGGKVAVRARPEGGPALFRLEVEDTGVGIEPDDVSRLFAEFQQVGGRTSNNVKGTGLGLALTKRLVEAQGGTVGAESRVGRGSTFFAILPRQARPTPRT